MIDKLRKITDDIYDRIESLHAGMDRRHAMAIGAAAGVTIAAIIAVLTTWDTRHRRPEIFTEMAYSVAGESQADRSDLEGFPFADGRVQRPTPEGTVYFGQLGLTPWMFDRKKFEDLPKEQQDAINAIGIPSKIEQQDFDANLARGEQVYRMSCSPCHGRNADGQAPVNNYGMGAVPLRTTTKSDGAIYHQIVAGGSLMPSHADRVRPDDRWRVILYLRSLQGKYDEK